MPYRRRYYRRSYSGRDKYSVEQAAGELVIPENSQDANVVVVPPADLQGMRKVKHITISLTGPYGASNNAGIVYWALVFVPAGYNPNTLTIDGQAMYEPNQFVMNCGVNDTDAGPIRIHSPVSRNLNSGDKVLLIVKAPSNAVYKYVVRYAVTLQ